MSRAESDWPEPCDFAFNQSDARSDTSRVKPQVTYDNKFYSISKWVLYRQDIDSCLSSSIY